MCRPISRLVFSHAERAGRDGVAHAASHRVVRAPLSAATAPPLGDGGDSGRDELHHDNHRRLRNRRGDWQPESQRTVRRCAHAGRLEPDWRLSGRRVRRSLRAPRFRARDGGAGIFAPGPRDRPPARPIHRLAGGRLDLLRRAAVGMFVGSLMPWLDQERIGPHDLRAYFWGLAVLAWPTLMVLGAVLFALASRVQARRDRYVALVGLLVAYFSATAMFGDLESRGAAAFLDPFGLTAFDLQTRYWTIAEKNSRIPALGGELIWNRVGWVAVALAILLWAVATFRFDRAVSRRKARRIHPAEPPLHLPCVAFASSRSSRAARRWRSFSRSGDSTRDGGARPRVPVDHGVRPDQRPHQHRVPRPDDGHARVAGHTPDARRDQCGLRVPVEHHHRVLRRRTGVARPLVAVRRGRRRAARLDMELPSRQACVRLWVAGIAFIGAGMIVLIGYQLSKGYTNVEPRLYLLGFDCRRAAFSPDLSARTVFPGRREPEVRGLSADGRLPGRHGDGEHAQRQSLSAALRRSAECALLGHERVGTVRRPAFLVQPGDWTFAAGILAVLCTSGGQGYDSRWHQRLQRARARLRESWRCRC